MTILSDGDFRYEILTDWVKLPEEVVVGDVAAVAVDERDRVFLFTRGEHPMIVLDREGNVLRTWGHGLFKHAHGLHIGPDGTLYCTDDVDHTVRHCTAEGKLLMQLGVPGKPASFMTNSPFHRCTHTALSPQGDVYVSDGYGNACIHKFTPDGRHLTTWGRSGCSPGEFFLPHNLVCDADGWVYVADRENHRVQVFDGEGRYETQWNNLHRPCALCATGGVTPLFYVGELGPTHPSFTGFPNLGPRLVVLNRKGERVANLTSATAAIGPDRFVAPHGIAVDSHGDVYISEVANALWPWIFPGTAIPARLPTIRKLRRLPLEAAE
ncbi:MAG TPA: peptidyl-alpha-hydroxyglycine alpha-amidating lyase family protein [Steroidobacteraceae bacterium]|jgi:sugar lactone lactonase YvrE